MNAGKLRHRILIDAPLATQNENGEEVNSWVRLAQVWGSVEPLNGREQIHAAQMLADVNTRIRIRWSPMVDAITAEHRLIHLGVIYDIKSIVHTDYGRRELEIMCKSGLNDG